MSLFLLNQIYYDYEAGDGYYDDAGRYVEGTRSIQKNFQGTIQPMTSREIASLPEAEQNMGWVKVYSSTQLPVARQGETGKKGALVLFNGELYECVKEGTYSSNLINHFKYNAVYRGLDE